ncbi:MAG TPA: ABC transporter transmembrane domain-containing protein, partial [Bacillota bacterium]|nr:ABC transporter transmembrane domain-containing protein [Bacillota bacterium]
MGEKKLANKEIPLRYSEKLDSRFPDAAFYIVGDMKLDGQYGECAFAAGSDSFAVLDDGYEGIIRTICFSDVEKADVKRMYGNACLYVYYKDGTHEKLLRFTYAAASLFEAAAQYITNIAGGGDRAEELDVINATYERLMSVCPKCGRALLHPGAECIQCQSKSKIVGKLVKYVMPEKKTLIVCLFLSCITTAMALLPPYITARLVDDIIPNSDKKMLASVVVLLFCSYILQYLIGGIRGYYLRRSGDRIVKELRNDVYAKAQKLPMRFYDRTSTGSVINRISGDTATLQAFILRISQEVVVQFFLLIGIMIIMLTLNWKLSLISLLPVPLVVVGAKIFGRKIAPFYRRIWRRWAGVSSVLTDTIPCVRIIKSFAGEKRAVDRFEKYNEEWYKVDIKSAKITNAFPAIVSFVVTCGSLLIWSIGGSW